MKRGLFVVALALGAVLVLGSAVFAGAPTGPIPMYATFRDNCRPTVGDRDCLLGLPRIPDRVGGDFIGGYTDQVDGVESVIDRDGTYHLHTGTHGTRPFRNIWLDLREGSGSRPFVINYAEEVSFASTGTVPLHDMKVSTEREPFPYVGTVEIRFEAEFWSGMLLFDKVTITRLDEDVWTIEASGDVNVKLADGDRRVLGTYAMPFSLKVTKLPGPE